MRMQLAIFAGRSTFDHLLEIRPLNPLGQQVFVPVREIDRGVAEVMRLRDRHEVFIGAAPRTRHRGDGASVGNVWCIWADCDSPEAVERLHQFKPEPTMIVKSGGTGREHGYWALSKALAPEWAKRANIRMALRLGADRGCVDAARIMRAVGSIHRKAEPRLVTCVRCESTEYAAREVVGDLPDPPEQCTPRPMARTERPANLDGLLRTVRNAQRGNRNATLYWAACRLREHGDLDESHARAALHDAARTAGLSEHEITNTIASALDRRAA
jgi:hypothetical protein